MDRKDLICIVMLLLSFFVPSIAVGQEKTSQEMANDARKMINEMREMRDASERALRSARADKDIGRLDCINQGLIALKGVLRLAEAHLYDLQTDLRNNNRKGVKSQYLKIKIAKEKGEDLYLAIKSCGGYREEGIVEGKPVVEKITDPDLPTEDPTAPVEAEELLITRPPMATPYE